MNDPGGKPAGGVETQSVVDGDSLSSPSGRVSGDPLNDTLDAGDQLDRSAGGLPAVEPDRYDVLAELAQGGGGRLLRAWDRRLARVVAIKCLRKLSDVQEARFRREALVTARLQHPGIVPIHDLGRWTTGEPYYAMKLVSGSSLHEVLEPMDGLAARLPLVANLAVVAETVAFAHDAGIIHRDLKPANIMLGAFGETVVVDWGLAKHIGDLADLATEAPSSSGDVISEDVTIIGTVVGTPAYMSPEQALSKKVDRRTDVYALGAVLYRVLAGRPPFSGALLEIIDQLANATPPPLATLVAGAPAELIAIAEKAMARDRDQRYPDAAAFALDLKRFLEGQLVAAHRYSSWALIKRFCQRHRRVLAVVSASLVALVAFGGYSVRRVVHERGIAERALGQADAEREKLELAMARQSVDRDPTLAVAWAKRYAASGTPDWIALTTLVAEARSRGVARHVIVGCGNPVMAPDGRIACARHGHVDLLRDGKLEQTFDTAGSAVTMMAFAWDSDTLFVGHEDGRLDAWPVERRPAGQPSEVGAPGSTTTTTGRTLTRLGQAVGAISVSDDGKLVALGGVGGAVRVITLGDNGPGRDLVGHERAIVQVQIAAGGRWAASTSEDDMARVWNLTTGEGRTLPSPPTSGNVRFSPAGDRLAWGSEDGAVRLLDLASGEITLIRGHEGQVNDVAFSHDGTTLASAGTDKTIRLVDLASGHAEVLTGHAGPVYTVEFSPDGRLLESSGTGGDVRLWDLRTKDKVILPTGDAIRAELFSADSRTLLIGRANGEARVFPVAPAGETVLRGHDSPYVDMGVRPDGILVSAGGDNVAREWDLASLTSKVHKAPVPLTAFAIDPAGRRIYSLDDHKLSMWALDQDVVTRPFGDTTIFGIGASRDYRRVVAGGVNAVYESFDGAAPTVLGQTQGTMWHIALSPDGRWVAAGGDEPNVHLFDRASGTERELVGHDHSVLTVSISLDGKWVVSGGVDPMVRLWDTATGAMRTLEGHTSNIQHVGFSPDGTVVASISADKTVRLWNLADGSSRVLTLDQPLADMGFDDDSKRISGIDAGGALRIWDVATGAELEVLTGHNGTVDSLVVLPHGAGLATTGEDRTIRIWKPSGRTLIHSLADLDAVTSAELTANDSLATPTSAK